MPATPIELTEAEWAIMKAVWELQPCAAPGVQEHLFKQRKWTYSTVRTIMDRMVAKGLLRASKIRNLTLYRSAITRAQAQRSEILYTLKHAFNGALTPMVQCLLETERLSDEDLDQIEALIRRHRSPK